MFFVFVFTWFRFHFIFILLFTYVFFIFSYNCTLSAKWIYPNYCLNNAHITSFLKSCSFYGPFKCFNVLLWQFLLICIKRTCLYLKNDRLFIYFTVLFIWVLLGLDLSNFPRALPPDLQNGAYSTFHIKMHQALKFCMRLPLLSIPCICGWNVPSLFLII